ncbi:glycoside hydrolase family 15 protein [Nonomuraea ferruginea]
MCGDGGTAPPVRVGNDAWRQRQLDVYGELLDAAHQTYRDIGPFDPLTRSLLIGVAETAARRWQEPDQSLWEVRGPSRALHALQADVLGGTQQSDHLGPPCWGAASRVADWTRVRDEIHAAILTHGWNEQAGAFTQTFGGTHVDAATLMMPLVGFLPPDDPRIRSTVQAVATRLTDARGLVYRYRSADGLAGQEGPFLLCTFWLAHKAIGNYPQALSHIGLINAARAIGDARRSSDRAPCGGLLKQYPAACLSQGGHRLPWADRRGRLSEERGVWQEACCKWVFDPGVLLAGSRSRAPGGGGA